jgi:hypothetical protein
MAHISPDNEELVNKFVALSTTLVLRQKAVEIALVKLGLSDETWSEALQEAADSMPESFRGGAHPLESYLDTITATLNTPAD